MDQITIRYGESVTLPIDTADATAVSATIYIGKPGEAYVLSKVAALTNGVGTFVFDTLETEIPLGTYYYQINVLDDQGNIEKFPSPDNECEACENSFPRFVVCEALDEIEVS